METANPTAAAVRIGRLMVVELNTGQMVEDVKISAECEASVEFYGRPPGSIPTPDELAKEVLKVIKNGGPK